MDEFIKLINYILIRLFQLFTQNHISHYIFHSHEKAVYFIVVANILYLALSI